jgi:branched-subunit amino acid ABC-type transport system permease component
MKDLLPFIVNGFTTGSVYALAGMGLVLTYRTSGTFNFAHGAQAALGAFLMYSLWQQHGLPWPVAALLSVVLAGVAGGLLLERLSFLLSRQPTGARVVAMVGLLVGLQGALVAVYGPATLQLPPFLPQGVVRFPGVNVRVSQILITVIALVAAIGLFAFFRRARLGVAMQGVVDDSTLLGLQGISPIGVRRRAWAIGSCFAAVSGILLAPTIGVDAGILTLLVVQAFGAAAVGAFNSLVGTYLGGLALGLTAELSKKVIAGHPALSGVPSILPFLILFAVLIATPRWRLIERGSRVVSKPAPPASFSRATTTGTALLGLALLVALPRLVGGKLPIYTNGLVFVILFASLGLLVRTSGQVSLCHMAFAAVGAAGFGHAAAAGLPWLLAVLVGGLIAVPVGAFVAVPAIRLSGVYLALATFGFGILVERIFYRTTWMFGPGNQIKVPRPALGSLKTGTDTGYYYVVLAVAVACSVLVVLVRRSRLGRLLRGLADSPEALTAFGTSTNVTLLAVFSISAFLAGVAGAVAGPITRSATGFSFRFDISLVLLAVLAMAGRQPILSAYLAAFFYVVGPSYITNQTLSDLTPVLFGGAAILAVSHPVRALLTSTFRSRRMVERRDRPGVAVRRDPVVAS